jgi:hypothetical protein
MNRCDTFSVIKQLHEQSAVTVNKRTKLMWLHSGAAEFRRHQKCLGAGKHYFFSLKHNFSGFGGAGLHICVREDFSQLLKFASESFHNLMLQRCALLVVISLNNP